MGNHRYLSKGHQAPIETPVLPQAPRRGEPTVPDTVTANGVGFVELGSAIREAFYLSPAQTSAPSEIASDEFDDAAELEDSATTQEAPKH